MSLELSIPFTPFVSVIVPVYNGDGFIEETLRSILSQTYENFEVLVIDDGSEDRTALLVENWTQRDSRIKLLQTVNLGVAKARNLGIKEAKGEYIALLDGDDIWWPMKLEKQVDCLLKSPPTVGVVYTWSLDINELGDLTGGFHQAFFEGDVYVPLIYKCFLGNASGSLIRRSCFDKIGGFNAELREKKAQGSEDWDLHLRLAEFYEFRVVPEFLVGYRQLSYSMSCNTDSMERSYQLVMADVKQRHPELPDYIYRWSGGNFYIYLAMRAYYSQNYQRTLDYLKKSLSFDPLMTLIRHNLYELFLKSLWRLVQGKKSQVFLSPPAQSVSKTLPKLSLDLVEKRIKIHRLLLSQIWEKQRFKFLVKNFHVCSNLQENLNPVELMINDLSHSRN